MIYTENTLWMQAPPDRVFRLASNIAEWPRLLPHYRWVRVLEDDGTRRLARMSARRSWIPTWWTSVQQLEPAQRRIRYAHTGGITTGMDVEWRLSEENGGTRAIITHRF